MQKTTGIEGRDQHGSGEATMLTNTGWEEKEKFVPGQQCL